MAKKSENHNFKRIISYAVIFAVMPVLILIGIYVFNDRVFMLISWAMAVCACIPFFLSFENKKNGANKAVILAVMTALSVLGRFAFIYVPAFKPVTAIVMICGMYLGAECGFLCGALSALISNFIFMQGPWTPFQMFIWGFIGFVCALLSEKLKKSKIILALSGAGAGIVYSAFMDIWVMLSHSGIFSWKEYLTLLGLSLPTVIVYVVSNIIFLILLAGPVGKKLERVKTKYGI